MDAYLVAQADETLRFVVGHPMRHPVAQAVDNQGRIFGEPIRAVRVEPAAPAVKLVRVIPMEQGDVWSNVCGQERIDQPVVKIQPGGVRLAGSGRAKHAATRSTGGKPECG